MSHESGTFSAESERAPTAAEIKEQRKKLGKLCRKTPVWEWTEGAPAEELGHGTSVFLKLELLQFAGSFKPRGALTNMMRLEPDQLTRGVVTVSAGNHAMATGYAAEAMMTTAKVVMPKGANPARVAGARAYGAEVELVADVHEAFARVKEIEEEEGRTFVHPFDGPLTVLGTATLGYEFAVQTPDLDAVLVPIGGGGLCAGVATAFKALQPDCRVIGIEPKGADTMHRSFAAGKPESIKTVDTIADSLGAPHAAPYTYRLCREHVDQLVLIDDRMICGAMATLFRDVKLVCEPAGAASTAALLGPLRSQLEGKRVGLVVCGSNIDLGSFVRYVDAGLCGVAPSLGIRPQTEATRRPEARLDPEAQDGLRPVEPAPEAP